jgi:hypothetical protein
MPNDDMTNRIKSYYVTAVLSLVFAVVGFSYNAWRLELSETNSNIRTASFAVLTELSALEQNIYAAHYDKNQIDGSARKGWVKVGLINDLSVLNGSAVVAQTDKLKQKWATSWQTIPDNEQTVEALVSEIDKVRQQVKVVLSGLE